jgi:hypothetical protein
MALRKSGLIDGEFSTPVSPRACGRLEAPCRSRGLRSAADCLRKFFVEFEI